MIYIQSDEKLNHEDIQVIQFFMQLITFYNISNIDQLKELVTDIEFENYVFGFGGTHLWISRIKGDKRVAIFSNTY